MRMKCVTVQVCVLGGGERVNAVKPLLEDHHRTKAELVFKREVVFGQVSFTCSWNYDVQIEVERNDLKVWVVLTSGQSFSKSLLYYCHAVSFRPEPFEFLHEHNPVPWNLLLQITHETDCMLKQDGFFQHVASCNILLFRCCIFILLKVQISLINIEKA